MDYQGEINNVCASFDVNPLLVRAIVQTESSGNRYAMRFEPMFHTLYKPSDFAKALSISNETEVIAQKCSWGLMQVMGATARELGFDSLIPMLCEIDLGILYGVKYLKRQLIRYKGSEKDAVAAYNAGSVRLKPDGTYVNSYYVKSVFEKLKKGEK